MTSIDRRIALSLLVSTLAAGCSSTISGSGANGADPAKPGTVAYYLPGGGASAETSADSSSWIGRCEGAESDDLRMEIFANETYTATLLRGDHTDNGAYSTEGSTLVFREALFDDTAMTCAVEKKPFTLASGRSLPEAMRCGIDATASKIGFFGKCAIARFVRADDAAAPGTPATPAAGHEVPPTPVIVPPVVGEPPPTPSGEGQYGAVGDESSSWTGTCESGIDRGDTASVVLTAAGRYSGGIGSSTLLGGSYYTKADAITGVRDHFRDVELSCVRAVSAGEQALHCSFMSPSSAAQCGTVVLTRR